MNYRNQLSWAFELRHALQFPKRSFAPFSHRPRFRVFTPNAEIASATRGASGLSAKLPIIPVQMSDGTPVFRSRTSAPARTAEQNVLVKAPRPQQIHIAVVASPRRNANGLSEPSAEKLNEVPVITKTLATIRRGAALWGPSVTPRSTNGLPRGSPLVTADLPAAPHRLPKSKLHSTLSYLRLAPERLTPPSKSAEKTTLADEDGGTYRLPSGDSEDSFRFGKTKGAESGPGVQLAGSTLHLDGAALGRWAVHHLERTLARPPSGMTGVDPRAAVPRTRVSPF